MCCCGKPNVNGQPGYSWDGKQFSTRSVDPPQLEDGAELLFDLPGRCGGLDSHCHHYRLVKQFGTVYLLVKHGGGEEKVRISNGKAVLQTLCTLDDNAQYWILSGIYHAYHDGERDGQDKTTLKWRIAAAEKRIKTRKMPGQNFVKVWIDQPEAAQCS